MNAALFVAILIGILLVLLFSAIGILQRRNKSLRQQLVKLKSELQQQAVGPETFTEQLLEVERSVPLLAPAAPPHTPDRYRYIRQMVGQGMSAAQIAPIFEMGEAEVEQIVQLSRLKKSGPS